MTNQKLVEWENKRKSQNGSVVEITQTELLLNIVLLHDTNIQELRGHRCINDNENLGVGQEE